MTSNSEKTQWRRPKRSRYTGTGLLFTGTAVSNYSLIFTLCFEFLAYRGLYFLQSHANQAQIIHNRPINYFHL